MERVFNKQTAGVLAFILAFFAAVAFAPQALADAQAADLQAASLTVQAAGTNVEKGKASTLKMGKAIMGEFYHADGTPPSTMKDYWYKFKTSKRTSAYLLEVDSVDGRMLFLNSWDAKDNEVAWGEATAAGIVEPTSNFNLWLPKNQWIYFRWSCTKTSQDYNKRFKMKVTEYPVFNWVTGLKATKKTSNSLTLKWKKQANVTKYQVKYRPKGGAWKTKTVKSNTVKLSKLKKNKEYQVRVRAYCKNGYYEDAGKVANWTDWTTAKKFKTTKK